MTGRRGTLLVALAACLFAAARAFKYAVVLDCGSRGTRLHVFRRKPDGGVEDMLPQPLKVVPGLSTFANRPHGAVEYLLPLLKFAGLAATAAASYGKKPPLRHACTRKSGMSVCRGALSLTTASFSFGI